LIVVGVVRVVLRDILRVRSPSALEGEGDADFVLGVGVGVWGGDWCGLWGWGLRLCVNGKMGGRASR
ncbi:MAG: hypothetical protein KJ592_03330, partial [Nanoarchaeota archaeon]|nr:hypothetical protein [Nanoarchaeota archaeon]